MTKYRYTIHNRNNQIVGAINLTRQLLRPDIAKVGYFIDELYTKRGYASHALRAVIPYAFDNLGIKTLFADIKPGNTGSVLTATHAGFRDVGPQYAKQYNLFRLDLQG